MSSFATADPASTDPDSTEENQGWTLRLILSLVSICLVLEMLTISYLMVATALPEMIGHYQTTQGAWVLSAFLLSGAVTSPILGKLSDMYGKRRMLLLAISCAAAGAVISAVAPNFGVVVLGRVFQGLLVPCMFLSYSLMRDVYPARILALAVSIATGGMGLITIPSPWLTGWLLDTSGFRAVFWFFAIVLAVLAVVVRLTTAESKVRVRSRVDYLGALLLGAGLAGVLTGVSMEADWGWSSARTIGCLVGGFVILAIWLVTALRVREPLIDVRFFRRRSMSLTAVAGGLTFANTAVYSTLLPMLCMTPAILGLHYGFGVDAEGYAIFQAPIGAASVVGGLLVGLTISRVPAKWLLITGSLLLALGSSMTGLVNDSRGVVIVWAAIQGLGLGLCYAATPNLVIQAVPGELQGSMASMVQVFQGAFSAAVPVVVFTVLNSGTVTVLKGSIFYSNSGLTIGFLIGGATALVAALVAVALPQRTLGAAPAARKADAEPAPLRATTVTG